MPMLGVIVQVQFRRPGQATLLAGIDGTGPGGPCPGTAVADFHERDHVTVEHDQIDLAGSTRVVSCQGT